MNEVLRLARNIVRAGRVNNVDTQKGTVEVLFEDRDDLITPPLPLLKSASMPEVGEQVVCLFMGNGIEMGFCLGGFYSDEDLPGGVG